MSYEHIWFLITVLGLAAWGGVTVWARHLRQSKRLEVRQMIHRERMAAFEKGLEPSALPEDLARTDAPWDAEGPDSALPWVQRSALAAGLTLVFVGLGMFLGFHMVPETRELAGLGDLAFLGVVPVFAGVGLLLFWWLDRRISRGERE